jgi:hypothetical protein
MTGHGRPLAVSERQTIHLGNRSDRLNSSLELGSKCRSSDFCGPLQVRAS